MVIFLPTKQRISKLAVGFLAALITAFSLAAQASAETVGVTATPPAVERPSATEQVETAVSTVPAPEADAPEPVETEQIASAVASSPSPAGEDSPVDPTAGENPAPAARPSSPNTVLHSVVDHVSPPSSAADAVATTAAGVSNLGRSEPDGGAGPTSTRRVAELADGIRRDSLGTVALATERLRTALADPTSLPADLLHSIVPTSDAAEIPVGPSPAGEPPAAHGTTMLTQPPRIGSPLSRSSIEPELASGAHLTTIGGFEISKVPVPKLGDGMAAGSPTGGLANTDAASGATSIDGRAGPTPSDAFPPTPPESPATAAAGSGNTPFLPIVALLALLALVAPAATRRLGKAPDFRAPTPFTCALERPG